VGGSAAAWALWRLLRLETEPKGDAPVVEAMAS